MTSFDANVERIQDEVETALCDENSHVILFYDSEYKELYTDPVGFDQDVKTKEKNLKTRTRTRLTTIDLSKDIEPQIKRAKSSLKKKYPRRTRKDLY